MKQRTLTGLVLAASLTLFACGDSPDGARTHDPGGESSDMWRVGRAVLHGLEIGEVAPLLAHAVTVADREAVLEWKAAEGLVSEEELQRARADFGKIVAHAREEIRKTLPRCREKGQQLGIDWAEAELVGCEDGGGDDIYIAFRHRETHHVILARSIRLPRGRVLTGRIRPPRGLDTLSPERRARILQLGH